MTRIFVYGTLRYGYSNHSFIKGSYREEDSRLSGFDMYTHGSFPYITKGNGEVVVESYMVDNNTLGMVDMLEGHPNFYKRTEVIDCMGRKGNTYVFSHSTSTLEKIPSGDWNEYKRSCEFYM